MHVSLISVSFPCENVNIIMFTTFFASLRLAGGLDIDLHNAPSHDSYSTQLHPYYAVQPQVHLLHPPQKECPFPIIVGCCMHCGAFGGSG